MPIFRDEDSEEGTFGPSMSAAMSMHHDKKDKKKSEKDKHIEEAKKHLDAASESTDGGEHAEEEDSGGLGLSSLTGGEEE